MKTITIYDKEYPIDCKAITEVLFRNTFNAEIMDNVKIIYDFIQKQTIITNQIISDNKKISDKELIKAVSLMMLDDVGVYKKAITEIAYICCYTANRNIGSYEEWLEGIDRPISTNDDWIVEVTKLVVDSFC